MKIRLAGAELYLADGRTDTHNESNSRFSQILERAKKYGLCPKHIKPSFCYVLGVKDNIVTSLWRKGEISQMIVFYLYSYR
jgi:hypothetical protein